MKKEIACCFDLLTTTTNSSLRYKVLKPKVSKEIADLTVLWGVLKSRGLKPTTLQKQSLLKRKKDVLRNFAKFAGKHLCPSLFFNKVAGLRSAILLKKRLWHSCFPVTLIKFLRTPFLTEHLRWLLVNASCWLTWNF